jgi:hypothetical protein
MFSTTAFSEAIIVVCTPLLPSAATVLQITYADGSLASITTDSSDNNNRRYHRQLQSSNKSATVDYSIHKIPDTATAQALQKRLTAKSYNVVLTTLYNEKIATGVASSMVTTATTNPNDNSNTNDNSDTDDNTEMPSKASKKSSPIGIIIGCITGVLVLCAAVALYVWRKRKLAVTSNRKHIEQDPFDNSSNITMLTNTNSYAKSSVTAVHEHPVRHYSNNNCDGGSNRTSSCMLISMDSQTDIERGVLDDADTNGSKDGVNAPIATTYNNTEQVTDSTNTNDTNNSNGTLSFDGVDSIYEQDDSVSQLSVASGNINSNNGTRISLRRRVAHASRAVPTHMANVVSNTVSDTIDKHGAKAELMWEGIGAVAEHIPYIR